MDPRDTSSGEPDRTDDLVRRTRSGDPSAFAALYVRIAPAVFAWASLRVPPSLRPWLDAEDLVQTVWLRAEERFDAFDPAVGPFRAWVFGIARHVLVDAFRRLGRLPIEKAGGERPGNGDLAQVPALVATVSSQVARDEELARCLDLVRALPPAEQELLVRHGLEGFPLAACAASLGISEEAAKKRWQRLRARLAEASLHRLTDEG